MLAEEIEIQLKQILAEKVQLPISSLRFLPIGGGSINDAYKITINNTRNFFIKINDTKKLPSLFEKEKNGLSFIAEQKIIRTPQIIDSTITGTDQILVLEWIEQGLKSQIFWKIFGEQLAQLHKKKNENHGFYENNYMGALTQNNQYTESWIDFFTQRRLQPQVELGLGKQLLSKKHAGYFEKLYLQLKNIFEEENASLLHGDLWGGNFMCDDKGLPVLIDPAVYFGHRSMDLAMTTLFGGFDKTFYESYHYHFPFPRNYREQWDVCNLYPLLIHLNLFGSGYLHDIESVLKKF
jgi:fructosamine-3-kinase